LACGVRILYLVDTASTIPRQRVLVFGGTFDPPHLAHTRLPRLVAERLGCERILYVPAAINPLKSEGPTASRDHRIAMLVLALADVPQAQISTVELDRPGPSYTIDTLRTLQSQFGSETELRLLIGSDQALEFDRWKDWREILKLATPVMMLRPPWNEQGFRAALAEKFGPTDAPQWERWTVFPAEGLPVMDVSATEIRRRLNAGESLDGLVDPAVATYIRASGLYSSAHVH
jgi:nicotinate-nucleotide adenylyltransferase